MELAPPNRTPYDCVVSAHSTLAGFARHLLVVLIACTMAARLVLLCDAAVAAVPVHGMHASPAMPGCAGDEAPPLESALKDGHCVAGCAMLTALSMSPIEVVPLGCDRHERHANSFDGIRIDPLETPPRQG